MDTKTQLTSNPRSAHTPGPWKRETRNRVSGPKGCLIARIIKESDDVENDEQQDANARLIAAAPTGLQEARSIYAWLLCELPVTCLVTSECQERLCGLRDFIALAEGRSSQEVQESFETYTALAKSEGAPSDPSNQSPIA